MVEVDLRGEARVYLTKLQGASYQAGLAFAQKEYERTERWLEQLIDNAEKMRLHIQEILDRAGSPHPEK
jgi:hypothetical protein